jgi:hypothetical protein
MKLDVRPNKDQLTRADAAAAADAIRRGSIPTMRDLRALKATALRKEHDDRLSLLKSLPKKDYIQLSGRNHNTLADQSAKFGLSLSGKTIDLTVVIRQFHEILAKFRQKLDREDPADAAKKTAAKG